jgi:hypothetical protein
LCCLGKSKTTLYQFRGDKSGISGVKMVRSDRKM